MQQVMNAFMCVFAGVSHAQSSVLGGGGGAAAGRGEPLLCRNRPAGAEPPHSGHDARLQRQGKANATPLAELECDDV